MVLDWVVPSHLNNPTKTSYSVVNNRNHEVFKLIIYTLETIFYFWLFTRLYERPEDLMPHVEQSIQEWTRFFKGCLPQILLGPLLNTLSHVLGKRYGQSVQ